MSDARDELVARVVSNLEDVRARIASVREDAASVRVVAVTKTFGVDHAAAAIAAGIGDLAESRVDELAAKHDALGGRQVTWHFLGPLQRNKIARLAPLVDVYQTLCRTEEVGALARHAPGARCYVQVALAALPGRHGCRLDDAARIVDEARGAGLGVEGLMGVASPDPAAAAAQFARLRRLTDELSLEGCSMGMSGDLEAACAAGSTMVRVGTALFGARPTQPAAPVA